MQFRSFHAKGVERGGGVDRGSTVTDDNRKSSFPDRWQEVDAVEGGERRRKESGSRRKGRRDEGRWMKGVERKGCEHGSRYSV